jgi:hypothetical protein
VNITAARRKLIADYRKDHVEADGCTDAQVEAMAFALDEVSTEALTHALAARGYLVSLEVG